VRQRRPLSDHSDGRRFHNPNEEGPRGLADFVKWMRTRRRGVWRPFEESPPAAPRPRIEDLSVTLINHATLLVQMNGVNVLTDPVFSERVSPVSFAGPRRHRPPGVRFDDLPAIDAVLVSHDHYDHLDLPSLRKLQERHRPRFVCGLGVGRLLLRSGMRKVTELDWWESTLALESVSVSSVPARHFSGRTPFARNRTLWTGFVLAGPAGNVFFAGDTGYGRHFAEIGKRHTPIRLALLPIGAYKPEWFMGGVHISPAQALAAHADLGASTSVGMHWGTFELADDGQDEPAEEIKRLLSVTPEPRPRFWLLGNGEGRHVPPPDKIENDR
jgi:L-ascorbate metabolism protein UlaG (beta-lactamase superfamily)